jgi:hypothetical protein
MNQPTQVQVKVRSLTAFETTLARLVRKAKRLGVPAPTYRVVGESTEEARLYLIDERESRFIGTETVIVHDVIVDVATVAVPGDWRFVARLETVKGNSNIIFAAPGESVPSEFRASGCKCDHCGVSRYRKDTFVVANGDRYMQVGSTCLTDFLDGYDTRGVANLFAFLGDIYTVLKNWREDECGGWQGGSAALDLRKLVSESIMATRKFGWLSKSRAYANGGTSTAERVRYAKKGELTPDSQALAQADEVIGYFAGLHLTDEDDQLAHNAHAIACAGYVSERGFGLACALPVCHRIALKKAAWEAERALARANSQHIGEVGKRQQFTARVKRVVVSSGYYGINVMTIMEDDNGNVLVGKDLGVKEDERIAFTATIKEHSEFNGVKQTTLLRATKVALVA